MELVGRNADDFLRREPGDPECLIDCPDPVIPPPPPRVEFCYDL
jgi:hypothetical protein